MPGKQHGEKLNAKQDEWRRGTPTATASGLLGQVCQKCKAEKWKKHTESSLISRGVERAACKTVLDCGDRDARGILQGGTWRVMKKVKVQCMFKNERMRTIFASVTYVQGLDSHVQSNSMSSAKKK